MNPLNFNDPVTYIPVPSLTQGGILVAWLMLAALIFFLVLAALKRIEPTPSSSRRERVLSWLRDYYWVAMLITGLGLGILATTFYLAEVGYSVAGIVNSLRAEAWRDTPNAEDLQNLATATAVLLAALAAAATMIFQLVKVWIAERQTKTSEQSHITDQINKAVEGLGTEKNVKTDDGVETTRPNIEVRVGAIYALERIAQDSPRDHVQIMEILTAYVRENACAGDAQKLGVTDPKSIQALALQASMPERSSQNKLGKEQSERYALVRLEVQGRAHRKSNGRIADNKFGQLVCRSFHWAANLHPRSDIQAAIHVIGRRSPSQVQIERRDSRYGQFGYRLDLQGCNLQGIKVSGLNFEWADFSGSHLDGAQLQGGHLQHANFEGARFRSANLQGAKLCHANLKSSFFELADLESAEMSNVDLKNSVLAGADLTEAILDYSKLNSTDLTLATLSRTFLRECELDNLRFIEVTFFDRVELDRSALYNCDLRKTNLSNKQLTCAFGDFFCRLPTDPEQNLEKQGETAYTLPKHWLPPPSRGYQYFLHEWKRWLDHPNTYIPHEKES